MISLFFLILMSNNNVVSTQKQYEVSIAVGSTVGYSGNLGKATSAQLNTPYGIFLDGLNNIYVADSGNIRIRKVNNSTGIITAFAGSGVKGDSGDNAVAASAQFNTPTSITAYTNGNIYVVDSINNNIRRIDVNTNIIYSFYKNGIFLFLFLVFFYFFILFFFQCLALNGSFDIKFDTSGYLYAANTGENKIIRITDTGSNEVTVVGTGSTGDGSSATNAKLRLPKGIAFDASGNLYIADTGNHRIRKVVGSTINTVVGSGTLGYNGDNIAATLAQLNFPISVELDSNSNIYIADSGNKRIRFVDVATNIISTIVGDGSTGYNPQQIKLDNSGNFYFSDTNFDVM
jgi:streptogramin lyase